MKLAEDPRVVWGKGAQRRDREVATWTETQGGVRFSWPAAYVLEMQDAVAPAEDTKAGAFPMDAGRKDCGAAEMRRQGVPVYRTVGGTLIEPVECVARA